MINDLDPDKIAANKSASAHDTLKKSTSRVQQFTEKSATAQRDVSHEDESVTAQRGASHEDESVIGKQSVVNATAAKVYTIREYNKLFCRTHSRTTKIRNSQPEIMFHRPQMRMPNKGRPVCFFVEGVNCQYNSTLLLCPGRTFRFLPAKTLVVLGCIWIGCRKNKTYYHTVKPVYAILVFRHDMNETDTTVYKCKITSLYNNITLQMDNMISQQLIDVATKKFANILKSHGHVRSYWENLITLGEGPRSKKVPSQRPRPKPKKKCVPTKYVQPPTVRFVQQPGVKSVQSLLKQLNETRSAELALIRDVAKSSKEAVTKLSETVNAVLERERRRASNTPPPKKKHKHKHNHDSPHSTSPLSNTDSPSPDTRRRRRRRRRQSLTHQFMSPVMMFPPTSAFMGTPQQSAFMGSPAQPMGPGMGRVMGTSMSPQMMMNPAPFQNMLYNYQQNMMYNSSRQ